MLSIFGPEEIIRNVYRISRPHLPETTPNGLSVLRAGYHSFLKEHQPYLPVNDGADLFISDSSVEDELASAYSHKNRIDDLKQAEIIGLGYTNLDRAKRTRLARCALTNLFEKDNTFAAVFALTIHSVFFKRSQVLNQHHSYGGSSSAALGAIWLSMPSDLLDSDVAELFVHELAHHLLFIDERNHNHFDYSEIAKPENYAFSAVLKLHRPLDKVVHSIVVGTELILARRKGLLSGKAVNVHPSTEELSKNVKRAYDSVLSTRDVDRLVSSRVVDILNRCAQSIPLH